VHCTWRSGLYSESYAYSSSAGNLSSKAGVSYAYNDTAHKHAVTHLGGVQKYWYDSNGNMTQRIAGSDTYTLTYDYENRLTQVKKNGVTVATFVYDGDGNRVRGAIVGGATTAYVGNHFEWANGTMVKYYYAGRRAWRCGLGRTPPASCWAIIWVRPPSR
jgi:YD repeat-containing protein